MQHDTTARPISVPSVEEIDLRSTGRTLWERRRLIGVIAALGLAVSATLALVQPNVYKASATIMPIDVSFERLSPEMSGGAVGALLSGAGIGRDGTVSDKLVALMRSRTVSEAVLKKHRLLPAVLGEEPKPGRERAALNQAYELLGKTVQAKPDPLSGLILISATHHNPEVAATLTNAVIAELGLFLNANSLTSTRRKREFLEEKVRVVSSDLEQIQAQLVSFQEENNLVSLESQTQSMVQSFMGLKSQLLSKQMEVALQSKSVSANDFELVGLREEVEQLKESLKGMELGTNAGYLALKDLPRMGARMSQMQRDLGVKQKVFELLTQQLELSKIEEAKEALSFQVIDHAVPPEKPSQPNRAFVLVAGALISLLIGLFVALVAGKPRQPGELPFEAL